MRLRRFAVLLLTMLLASALCGAFAEEEQKRGDAWVGKSRRDVVTLLGQPTKSKRAKDGAETLTYKLVLIDESAPPTADILVLNLPGVGLVGQVVRQTGPLGSVTIDPLELDREGRPTGGGVSSDASSTTSWDVRSGEKRTTTTGEKAKPSIRGKVTVRFEVGGDGVVRDWTVSGKK
jgi:hypothetical protein